MKLCKLLFSLCTLSCCVLTASSENSGNCVYQDYKPGNPPEVRKQFHDEIPVFDDIGSKLSLLFGFKTPPKPLDKDYDQLKKFCACALYKRQQAKADTTATDGSTSKAKSYRDIANLRIWISERVLSPEFSYLLGFAKYQPDFAKIDCVSDVDFCSIVRGVQQKSNSEPIYNIYVGVNETVQNS